MTKQDQFDRLPDDLKTQLLELGWMLSMLPYRDRIRRCGKMLDAMLAGDPDPEAQQFAEEFRRQYVS